MRTTFTILLLTVFVVMTAGCSQSKDDSAKKSGSGDAPELSARLKRLRLVATGMHEHAKANEGRFPAYDANGYSKGWKEKRKSGLSWRVYILPYIGQGDLNKQFKHDEPWDGPNNKQLVAKMPDVFRSQGVDKAGDTSLHIFIQDMTPTAYRPGRIPFGSMADQGSVGPKIRDLTDGTPNIIMLVEAGTDKAEPWTKPSGLKFDPAANPVDALGKVDQAGFLVAFFDGYAGRIELSVSADQMKALLQHNDRKPIGSIPGINRSK